MTKNRRSFTINRIFSRLPAATLAAATLLASPALLVIAQATIAMPTAAALEIQDMRLISPINGKPFDTVGVPAEQALGESNADMGYDDDGCRHSHELSEYSYYVATDPYTYFSALSAEWDTQSGQFKGAMPDDMKTWVDKTFNSDWVIDWNRAYASAVQASNTTGQPAPERADFVMAQQSIPVEKRYKYALDCYQKRGARPSVMAKVALMGAWAIRTFLNVPVGHQQLDGGYEEVNDKVMRKVKDGETFQLAKWLPIYKDIFENDSLTDQGYLVAGLTYFGMAVRDGDRKTCEGILDKLTDRFQKSEDKAPKSLLSGLVRERKQMYETYLTFTRTATENFVNAIKDEEFVRDDLPTKMLAVAEGLRRTGLDGGAGGDAFALARAMDWYMGLARMIETQPQMRQEIREQGKALAADANPTVQIGWLADQHLDQLTKSGVAHGPDPEGQDKGLINAILFDGLGRGDYVNPNWRPATGGNFQDTAVMLKLIGQALLDHQFRLGKWPSTLDDLWVSQILRDRNRVNRFCDPVNGARLLYVAPTKTLDTLPMRTVLVATAKPIPTNQGDVYVAFLSNNMVQWSNHPLQPGTEFSSASP